MSYICNIYTYVIYRSIYYTQCCIFIETIICMSIICMYVYLHTIDICIKMVTNVYVTTIYKLSCMVHTAPCQPLDSWADLLTLISSVACRQQLCMWPRAGPDWPPTAQKFCVCWGAGSGFQKAWKTGPVLSVGVGRWSNGDLEELLFWDQCHPPLFRAMEPSSESSVMHRDVFMRNVYSMITKRNITYNPEPGREPLSKNHEDLKK